MVRLASTKVVFDGRRLVGARRRVRGGDRVGQGIPVLRVPKPPGTRRAPRWPRLLRHAAAFADLDLAGGGGAGGRGPGGRLPVSSRRGRWSAGADVGAAAR